LTCTTLAVSCKRRPITRDEATPTLMSTTGQVHDPGAALLGAAAIVLVLSLLAGLVLSAKKARGGLITGYDFRVSTSKTMAYVWTAVVAWIVATEALIVIFGHPTLTTGGETMDASFGTWMNHVFDEAQSRELYLIFLGGPYAAAIMAKVIVTNRVNGGSLQKPDGDPGSNNPADAIRNDAGAVDLVDFQYVLFNMLVALAVVGAFISDVGAGLPTLADFLAILTGGAALTYTVNKGVTSNDPALTAVHPQSARRGDRVTVYGNNLAVGVTSDPEKGPTVTVAGVAATVVEGSAADDQVTFLVPAPPSGVVWYPTDKLPIIVTTAAGLTARLDNQFRVVNDDPVPVRLEPAVIAVAGAEDYEHIPIAMYGQFLAAPGIAPGAAGAAQLTVTDRASTKSETVNATLEDDHLNFSLPKTFPAPEQNGASLTLDVLLVRVTPHKGPLTLTVQTVDVPVLDSLDYDVVLGDPGAGLAGQEIKVGGSHLTAPIQPPSGGPAVAKRPTPLLVQLLREDGQQAPDPFAPEIDSDTAARFKLPAGIVAPGPGDEDVEYTVELRRGELTSDTLKLTVRARPTLTLTRLDPETLSAFDRQVTAHGSGMGDPSGARILAVPAKASLGVKITMPDDTELDGKLGTVTDTTVPFEFPSGTTMPADAGQAQIKITRDDHESDPLPLHLEPPPA
jgi:hypothetical protein